MARLQTSVFRAAVDLLARTTDLQDLDEASLQSLLTPTHQAEGFFSLDIRQTKVPSPGFPRPRFKPPPSSTLDGRRWIKSVWKGFEVTNPLRIIVLLHSRSAGRSVCRLVWFGSLHQPHTHIYTLCCRDLPSSSPLNDLE